MLPSTADKPGLKQWNGRVYCYICTHTVEARIVQRGRRFIVKPGQKCSRCGSSLDAAGIVQLDQAA